MASYSTSLRLVLPSTGEYSGTWGTQVNNGLTSLVDTSIAGTATITMTAANYTLSTANGATDESRAMFLVLGGTPGASYQVICPAVSKLYFVTNNTGFAQTVKTAAGTGISVPNGASMTLRCNGTDVVAAQNYFGSLTLGAALPIASGGTGSTSTTYCSLTANVTGTLPVANGGTGAATFTANNVLLGNGTSAFQVVAPGTTGNVLTSNGTTWVSSSLPTGLATISFGTTGLTPSTPTGGAVTVAGTLSAANGGTGATSLAANNVLLGNGTSAVQVVAPGTSGNVLTSNGTTWTSAAPSGFTNMAVFTSSGTWNIPSGVTKCKVTVTGGGGGGNAEGGTAGGTVIAICSLSGSTATVTVGAGGTGGGGAGGDSSFANAGTTTVTAYGGAGNNGVPTSGVGPAGALVLFGGRGAIRFGYVSAGYPGGLGGASYWGGGGAATGIDSGDPGRAYGSGGSGYGTNGGTGAAGAGGVVVIEY